MHQMTMKDISQLEDMFNDFFSKENEDHLFSDFKESKQVVVEYKSEKLFSCNLQKVFEITKERAKTFFEGLKEDTASDFVYTSINQILLTLYTVSRGLYVSKVFLNASVDNEYENILFFDKAFTLFHVRVQDFLIRFTDTD